MLCPGSPYPRQRPVPPSPSLSLRSQRSLRSSQGSSTGSRCRVVTYKSETTTSTGLFGKKKKDTVQYQFERFDFLKFTCNAMTVLIHFKFGTENNQSYL